MPRHPRPGDTDGQVGDLHAWLQRYGAMAPALALRLVADLGAELGALHSQGRAHGAVEPANVVLTARDGVLAGHLRDAGTALNEERAYVAPERHRDPAASSRGDIYAMGCLLWACLTGAPPYPGTGHEPLRLAGGEPPSPELEALLEGMLRTDPADRFSSAAEIGREAAWIADRIDPGRHTATVPEAMSAATSTSSWKNIGMVGVVGLSLLAIAVGGYAVVSLADNPPGPHRTAPAKPTESTPALSAPIAPASPAVVEKPTFTCWNGRTVAKKRKCREPEGIEGMYWIFPLLKGQDCRPRPADSTPGRRTLLECYFYGRAVRLDVSMWQDTPTGVSHYSSTEGLGSPATGAGPDGKPATYAWETTIPHRSHRHRRDRHVTVRLWMKHAYSVAVYTRQPTLADAVRDSGYYTPVPDKRYYGYVND